MQFILSAAFVGLLFLKVLGYITCSWWVVTMPLWFSGFLAVMMFLSIVSALIGVALGTHVFSKLKK